MNKFLTEYSAHITLFFTIVVACATVFYAWLTSGLVRETRRLREIQTEPKIQMILEPYDFAIHLIKLKVINIGLGAAKNITFESKVLKGELTGQAVLSEFTDSNFFEMGLRYLGPEQHVYSRFIDTSKYSEELISTAYSFLLTYESLEGTKYVDEITIDMAEIRSFYLLGKPNLLSIAQSMEKIQKDIHMLVIGQRKLSVNMYSSRDRKKERERMYAERNADQKGIDQ